MSSNKTNIKTSSPTHTVTVRKTVTTTTTTVDKKTPVNTSKPMPKKKMI